MQDNYLDALLSLPGIIASKVSHDGKWVAWSWFRTAPTAEVYLAPTDGSTPPIRMTDTNDNTIMLSWANDNQSILVMQDKNGNERDRIYRIPIDEPLNMIPLTEDDPNYFIRGGDLHNNYLVYGANVDLETGEEIEPTCMIRHNISTGERITLAKPQRSGFVSPSLSPDGKHILYTRADRHASGRQLWIVGIDGENDHEIVNLGDDVKVYGTWFPDSQRILVIGEGGPYRKLGIWDISTETLTWILDDPSRNIEGANVPANSEYIVIREVKNARLQTYLYHPTTAEEIYPPDLPGNLNLLAPAEGDEWIALYYSSKQPHDLIRLNLKTGDYISISRVWDRTSISPDDLTQAENFTWQSTDSLTIQGWLYRTLDAPRGTIVYVHGGPTAHSQDAINNQIQFFVQQGFNVLDPNYRGSTGFNLTFREAIKKDGWGGMEQTDIETGIKALIEAGIAQPGKVGITGTSYGGYSSWHAITHFAPDVLQASAPICGMTDLVVDYETTRPDLRPYSEEMLGGRPDQVPERYYERSPINFVDQIHGRLLIIQGMQDPNVSPDNVRVVTEKLQEHGVEYELLAFDDEGHGIAKPRNQKTLYQTLSDFFSSAFA